MALVTTTFVQTLPNEVVLTIDEDGNAANTVVIDLKTAFTTAGITRGGLYDFLYGTYADQAAAQTAGRVNLRINTRNTAGVINAGSCLPLLGVDHNVSAPAVAGNYRLSLSGLKSNAADTASFIVQIEYRHSVVR